MPNLRRPQLSAQVGSFMDEPEVAATIKAWATHLNATHGSIMRDVVQFGLPALVRQLAAEHGQLPDGMYADALKSEQERGAARAAAGAEVKRAERALAKRAPTKRSPRRTAARK